MMMRCCMASPVLGVILICRKLEIAMTMGRMLIGTPATLGLLLMAEPILSTLFLYNEFGIHDVQMSGRSLMAYSLGLVGFILVKVLVPSFTSRKDMKTPVRFGLYTLLVNMVLGLALIFPLAHAGLALSTSLGALFNAALLLWQLLKEKVYQPVAGWGWFLSRLMLANGLMAGGLIYFVDKTLWYHWAASERLIHLGLYMLMAIAVYALSLFALGFRPKQFLLKENS